MFGEAGVGEEPPRPEEPPAEIAEEILTEFRELMEAGVRDDLFEWVLDAREHGGRTCIAVDLAGDELGPFRTEGAALAALARGRFDLVRRRTNFAWSTPAL